MNGKSWIPQNDHHTNDKRCRSKVAVIEIKNFLKIRSEKERRGGQMGQTKRQLVSGDAIRKIREWPTQLARLMCTAWTDKEGVFRHAAMHTRLPGFWEQHVGRLWRQSEVVSAVLVDEEGAIVAHTWLKHEERYGGGWELGMSMAHPDAGSGAVASLCRHLLEENRDWHAGRVYGRGVPRSTAIQFVAIEVLGLRFAGIDKVREDGEWWEIGVLVDACHDREPFVPKPGVLGDPLGHEIMYDPALHAGLLRTLGERISTERGGGELPPRHAYVLSALEPSVRQICRYAPEVRNAVIANVPPSR